MSACARASWIAVACVLCASACKGGLGRSVVDRWGPPQPVGKVADCPIPPRCDDDYSGAPDGGVETIEIRPVSLETCGAFVPAACGDDALGPAPGGGADAGAGDACATTLTLGARDTVPNAVVLDCTAQRFDALDDADAPELVHLRGAVWRDSNVAITSMHPIALELEAATLQDVWIDLSGPITLRVTEDSSMSNVRMQLRELSAGEPRVDLRDSHAGDLAIAPAEDLATGSLALARMHLDHADLRARDLTFESAAANDLRVDAVQFTSADGWYNGIELGFDRAIIASMTAHQVTVSRCGMLTLVNGTFEHATVVPCTDGPTRVYGATIDYAKIDGDVDGDHAYFDHVRFGVDEDLAINGWDSTFSAVNFCSHTRAVRFGNLPTVRCSECADTTHDVDPHACKAPETRVTQTLNFCQALQADPLPVCMPVPERERPH
jgi:hypothetical protein